MFAQESPPAVARWPVVRVKEGGVIACTLLSGDFVRLVTHFWRSTFLCAEGDECAACALLPGRPYWYLPVLVSTTQRPSILELSSAASADLEQRCRFVGSAPRAGVQVELLRRSKKAPVRCEVVGQAESAPLVKTHEWVAPLMALYRLPPIAPGETLEAYGRRVESKVRERAKVAADRMRAGAAGRVASR